MGSLGDAVPHSSLSTMCRVVPFAQADFGWWSARVSDASWKSSVSLTSVLTVRTYALPASLSPAPALHMHWPVSHHRIDTPAPKQRLTVIDSDTM